MSVKKVISLCNGEQMPQLGFGTWQIGDVEKVIGNVIDAGYSHLDCAHAYRNEKEIGKVLKKKFNEGLDRKDIFITSKLWNTKHSAEDVRPALMQTLKDLQLDYVDLYLIHWPFGWKRGDTLYPTDEEGKIVHSEVHYMETWPELEKCVDEGLVKSIGLSNFNSKQITEVCNGARIKPAVLQVECHPYLIQTELIEHCRELNIAFTCYCPLSSRDRPWTRPGDPSLLEDPKLSAIGNKHNKTPAQVCLGWQIQRGLAVIPKSTNIGRIKENAEIFDFELSDEDMKEITTFDKNWRCCQPTLTFLDEVLQEKHSKIYLKLSTHPSVFNDF